ncbi:cupin domain-containing protein [Dactylosporangium darangshiense]|uniref:Glucose-6-phosphate isomerase n=1 Tax=Dactylosporangium darangshiense TaxID=579108 RepID=A0ABP8DI64_9ACTN
MITSPALLDDSADVLQELLDRAGPGVKRRLSDLLIRRAAGGAVHLTAAATAPGVDDPLLYTAYRDVLPPRQLAQTVWFADLVVYQPGDLPGGELHRSIGHWNTPSQLEVFQCLTGRILMITAWRAAMGDPIVRLQVCTAGELCAVPFGAWHLTCVLDGPAAVFNIYTDLPHRDHGAGQHVSPSGAIHEVAKYAAGEPVELTAVRASSGFMVMGSERGLSVWGTGEPGAAPAWLPPLLAGRDLPQFYAAATDTELDRLRVAAQVHLPSSAPTGRPGTRVHGC